MKMADMTCPNCGCRTVQGDMFCTACGSRLVETRRAAPSAGKGLVPHAMAISASELPDAPGVPGRIIGVKVSHGRAASRGYYDVHEFADCRVMKTRKVSPARGGKRFPPGWFDEKHADVDEARRMRIVDILQGAKYCGVGSGQGGMTGDGPLNGGLYMRILFEDERGVRRSLYVPADAERGQDELSRCARDVVRVIEGAFGRGRMKFPWRR